mmetsp:Transcript_41597/g.61008  ORF Transcript_41597/g.61008 Transcript_41597/m.61008 type:complete len:668 (+) Transcript_41597:92-2095(+)|eukprot:CAMPEP_0195529886 /NCGR_PEP_ID=MMETSP0794_2-20130614/32532_1 /TAXON_ID=515487 /ORGANISM="Stephanopyxis turris, Strain CCMP 815" /LENGTH=667 /DNA_ID=CAMNT_0040661261 /DNA_START=81 /DNA_END=2084 /DNA_ORIENTATION=+
MVKMFLVAASAAAAVATAGASRTQMEVEASMAVRGVPTGWASTGRAGADEKLELVFAVKQTNLDLLESTLMDVSDPDSENYGKHLSNDEVHQLVAPTAECAAAVDSFLSGFGAQFASPNGDFVTATLSVSDAEDLLEAEYTTLFHADSNTTVKRTQSYTLPADVAACVDFVAPTVHVPKPVIPMAIPESKKNSLRAPLLGNTPKHLRELYNSTGVEGKAASNKMAVTAFLGQKYKLSDLQEFWKLYCDGITCGLGEPKLVGDATTGLFSGVEAMLDIESITGVAGNIEAEFWGFSGHAADDKENEPFFKWLTLLANTTDDDVPKVFSTSYGEDEDTWSNDSKDRMSAEFQKAGARGISLLYASGDEGANCEDNVMFVPQTPGSSPYVTAVGGTTGAETERAVGLSSGGFSGYYAMPSYQADAVKQYLTSSDLPPTKRGYNTSNRAYPDISAQATDFTVVANGIPNPGVAGTSCAAPTASGIIALLNDARLQAGQSTMGFLNPFIYKNIDLWNDITSGASSGCEGDDHGWPAVAGWDAVTGVGTPNYGQLVTAAVTPSETVCKTSEYCCPDAKKCLTPTNVSCADSADSCSDGEVCCPLTKLCVVAGVDCTPPTECKSTEYCCPDALHCLTPTHPGTLCDGKHHCASDEICCPLTHECVTASVACTPP